MQPEAVLYNNGLMPCRRSSVGINTKECDR